MADQGTVSFYSPKALRVMAPEIALDLALKADSRRLTFYVGAGLSMSAPTDLPSGNDVQQRIAGRARMLLGVEVTDPAGETPTLEELGDAASSVSPEALERLRTLAADAIDFVGVLPNYAHEALALLLREGVVEVLSVNWDCAIESAARRLDFELVRVLRQEDRANRPLGPVMDKLNGCASQPSTLRVTRQEVDEPQTWAAHRVGAVLTDTTVVFVGLGTVGTYVADGVERILEASTERSAPIVVVSTTLSEAWQTALGDKADNSHADQRAEPFLDDLLRAAMRLALTRGVERAQQWASNGHVAGPQLKAGADLLCEAFMPQPAVPVWRWWRDGALGTSIGEPFILGAAGAIAFATACAVISDRTPEVSGRADTLVVELPDCYLEICSWPGETASSVVTRQAERVRSRRRRSVYRDVNKKIVSISVGHDGLLPVDGVSLDIADPGGASTDVVDGPERVVLEWIAGETFAQGVTTGTP